MLRLLLWAAIAVVVVLVFAAWRILRFNAEAAVYPPPATAVTAAQSKSTAQALAGRPAIRRADTTIDLAPSQTASVQLHVDGKAFFPAILADVKAAQTSIHVEEYGITPGEVADQFLAAFAEKARQGVQVRLVVDRHGSHLATDSRDNFDQLAAAGVQVVVNNAFVFSQDGLWAGDQRVDWTFDDFGHFDHRKMFIIDGKTAWVGGAGIEDYFYDGSFHDVFVRVTGDAVAQLQLVFLTDFLQRGGPPPAAMDSLFPAPDSAGQIPTTVVTNVPNAQHLANSDAIWDLMDRAERRLDIIDPYVADRGTIERIIAAAKRGVQVRFIVPASSNAPPVQAALEYHFADLLNAGVRVYLHPVLPHAKVVVADDRTLVGSTNLDAWALYRNYEVSLIFDDATVAQTFENQLFEPDIAASSPAVPPTGMARLVATLFAVFSPLL